VADHGDGSAVERVPLGDFSLVLPSALTRSAVREDRYDAADLLQGWRFGREFQGAPMLVARRWTMSTSSSMVAGSGSTTVLKRRRSALDSSLTPRSGRWRRDDIEAAVA